MEEENSEEFVPLPTLPEDLFFYLTKYHLSKKDSMALALTNESYASWHGSNRNCNVSRCFFLGISRWIEYFQQHINPLTITVFNVNHLYWFPPDVLVNNIVLLENLEDLNVLDTQVSLSHMPRVFSNCQKITRLGISLAGLLTLEDFHGDTIRNGISLYCMKKGFQRLTHLSIFNFQTNCPDGNYQKGDRRNGWPVNLGVLSWCRDCQHLKIDVSCKHNYIMSIPDYKEFEQFCIQNWQNMFPNFGWMSKMESLFINLNGMSNISINDLYVAELLSLLLKRKTDTLRSIWVNENSRFNTLQRLPFGENLCAPLVTSFYVGFDDNYTVNPIDLNLQRFRQIQHLGGFRLTSRLKELTDLRYVSFSCRNIAVLGAFCESHPLIESLHFTTENLDYQKDIPLIEPGSCKLIKLKDLVYQCRYPKKEVLDHLIETCPNIVSLYVGDTDKKFGDMEMPTSVNFLSTIHFHNLESLSLVGFQLSDGSYLPWILDNCPKLVSLNLSGKCVPDSFLLNIGQCLPKATNLHDLRLAWSDNEQVSSILLFLKNLLKCSAHLERLVLYNAAFYELSVLQECWECPSNIEDLLVIFVSEMDHLVALCLAGFLIDPKIISKVYQRVEKEILPFRPSFWFYLARKRPKNNDRSIPRIHYDDVVNPIDGFYAPPLSFE